jgi:hypothetical protein
LLTQIFLQKRCFAPETSLSLNVERVRSSGGVADSEGRGSGRIGNPVENHRGVQPHCVGVALSAVGGFMGLMATL